MNYEQLWNAWPMMIGASGTHPLNPNCNQVDYIVKLSVWGFLDRATHHL
jgi:hypothetical protein